MIAWWNRPGEPVLLVALGISLILPWRDLVNGPRKAGGQAPDDPR